MEIRNFIAELLSEHDCVIIPGFGGFIGNYTPARIDPVNHTFHPPSKQLLFNVNLRNNDGLLAAKISTDAGVTYQEACLMIEQFAEECLHALTMGESLQFARVGRLFAGKEGNIQFEQHRAANLLPESFGLSTFISPPVTQHTTKRKISRKKEVPARSGRKRRIVRSLLKWAAILAIPIAIAGGIVVMQHGKQASRHTANSSFLGSVFSRFSSASLFEKKHAPAQIQTASITPSPVSENGASTEKNVPVVAETPITSPVIQTDVSKQGNRFAVIIGAFRQEENAAKLIREMKEKGVEAAVYDQSRTGLYRVTMGTSNSREESIKLLSYAQSNGFKGAWLLAK